MKKSSAGVRYVDGFVIPLPKKNLKLYKKQATFARNLWMEHGALEYRECISDDLNVPFGLPFPKLVKNKPGELIVFAWISFRSKTHRDRVNALVMKDERMAKMPKKMPFDMKKMAYGGFKVLVQE